MRAAVYESFGGPVVVQSVPDPAPPAGGAVLRVGATGVCRSDWHGWQGHDPDVTLPHVPGHEIAGTVEAVGNGVERWRPGDRVTLPFVCACGECPQCQAGNQQICDRQTQPGFTHWGSYAEFVAVDYADGNLVKLPEDVDFDTAACLGCRFATAFRAVVDRGEVARGQWVAIHGCGGVGLSAVMIASALGASVVAVDIDRGALEIARDNGATEMVVAPATGSVVEAVRDLTNGGAHVSIDAAGSKETCVNSVACLRKRGKHVQVGLLAGADHRPPVPMELVIANELEIHGSHGMQAHRYEQMLGMIADGSLAPGRLLRSRIDLDLAAADFGSRDGFDGPGITVINSF